MQTAHLGTVSVVVPCYNAADFLEETIDSVLAQTHAATELVVADDGSTDASWRIVESYGARLVGLRLDHHGGCHARNVGARVASGRYVMFLDADDVLAPHTLEALVEALGDRTTCVAASAWRYLAPRRRGWVTEPARMRVDAPPFPGDYLRSWLEGWYIPPCALLWPRAAYDRTGGWDEALAANQDGDLMLRAFVDGMRVLPVTDGLSLYRTHAGTRPSVGSDYHSEVGVRSRIRVLEKLTATLGRRGVWERYAPSVGIAYQKLALRAFGSHPELARECERRGELYAGARAVSRTLAGRVLQRLLGLERKERVAALLARCGILTRQRRRALRCRELARTASRTAGHQASPVHVHTRHGRVRHG